MKFKIFHYNVQFMYEFIVSQHNEYRAEMISKYIIENVGDADVISFCEAFEERSRNILIKYLSIAGFKYSTPVLSDDNNYLSNGGIFILSKHPILGYTSYVFKNASGTDYLANKGIIRIFIKKERFRINIFTTHLQAWSQYYDTRNKQLEELKKYIEKFHFWSNEIVIISGDFNTNNSNIDKYLDFNFSFPKIVSYQKFTFDSAENSMYGIDGSDEDFHNRIVKKKGIISYPKNIQKFNFDHILYSKNHKTPNLVYTEILKPKVAKYNFNLWKIGWFNSVSFTTNDLSDHFPICSTFEFY